MWALIGLSRHQSRQLWVGRIVKTRLGGDLKLLAKRGELGRQSGREPTGVAAQCGFLAMCLRMIRSRCLKKISNRSSRAPGAVRSWPFFTTAM